jgi:alkanesulfonate monooxygenase SsuD/methylene tetrahydromethanopterin reductase-like flavin-dependent oxidoreductase (luciferase family)
LTSANSARGPSTLAAVFRGLGPQVTPEQANEIERLGYGTLWITGSPPAELSSAEPLLESTTALKVATGIVNIWSADAKTVAESFHRINTAYPGRFLLGIGADHVVIQVLGGPDNLLPTLTALAGALGLAPPS